MRKQSKSEFVEKYIRNAILEGRWKPEERLPSEQKLCEMLNISQTTLRIALKTLSNEGAIERRQRAGSYVSSNVKKQTILIVSNMEPLSLPSGYIFRQEIEMLQKKISEDGFNPVLCMGYGKTPEDLAASIKLESHPAFMDAVGVIGLQSLRGIKKLVKSKGIPTVELVSGGELIGNAIQYDFNQKERLSFEILKKYGFSETAIFMPDFTLRDSLANSVKSRKEVLLKHAKEVGINVPEEWFITVPWSWDWSQTAKVFKNFWTSVSRKPKAILFTQDVLTLFAVNAITELGIKVPEDLAILTHANKGLDFNFSKKMHSIVFDIQKATDTAWQELKNILNGEKIDQQVKYIEPYEIVGETLPPISMGDSEVFKIVEKSVLRSKAYSKNAGVWKSVSTYSFAEGMERYMVECDIFGQDRYCNYREMLSDDNGKNWYRERNILQENNNKTEKESITELFVGLDPISNSIYRGYKKGFLDNEANKNHESFDSFTKNGDVLLDVSRNGGRSFRQELNVSLLARESGFKETLHVSCSKLESFPNGQLVIPLYFCSPDSTDKCKRYNPVMLLGKPLDGGKYKWSFSEVMTIDKKLSPNGVSESSLAVLDDGRLLCIGRGGNNGKGNSTSHKWLAVSSDQGKSWSNFEALKYTDGLPLYSPSTCGYLLKKSDGRLFYVTNIFSSDDEIDSFGPRNQLHICEIDMKCLKVKKESVFCIDRCTPEESDNLALSNFWIYEDRETSDILVEYPRCFAETEELSDINLIRCRIKC